MRKPGTFADASDEEPGPAVLAIDRPDGGVIVRDRGRAGQVRPRLDRAEDAANGRLRPRVPRWDSRRHPLEPGASSSDRSAAAAGLGRPSGIRRSGRTRAHRRACRPHLPSAHRFAAPPMSAGGGARSVSGSGSAGSHHRTARRETSAAARRLGAARGGVRAFRYAGCRSRDPGDGAGCTVPGGQAGRARYPLPRPTIAVSAGGALNGSRRISRARNRLA